MIGETGESVVCRRAEVLLLALALLSARPLEELPLCCAAVLARSVGRRRDAEAAFAAGLEMGLEGRGLRLMLAPAINGVAGVSTTEGMLGRRGPVFGGDCLRPRMGDSAIRLLSSGSVTSATECRLV